MQYFLGFILVFFTSHLNTNIDTSGTSELTLKNYDAEILNTELLKEVNRIRAKRDINPLTQQEGLDKLPKIYQSELEFRRFSNSSSIERKVSKTLYEKAKKQGFTGGLLLPICGQDYALDYDRKSDFFHDKDDTSTELHIFYGSKSKSKRKEEDVYPIPYHTYNSLAKSIVKNLNSENRKELFNPAYKWVAVHAQWDYKSLNKNSKVPYMKVIFIVGGFQTALMR